MHNEFKNCVTLHEFIEAHVNFCNRINFDQILDSDKVTMNCCECGESFKIEFDRVALEMFCDKHKLINITEEHIQKYNSQLSDLRKRLHSM